MVMRCDSDKLQRGDIMSTTYYICRKHEHERSEAITAYIERIRRSMLSYLDTSLPPDLKDDVQLTDDLEKAIAPMCSKLIEHIGYDPEVRLCTITRERIIWHREELDEANFQETDELIVIDEYGKAMQFKDFLRTIGKAI